MNERKSERVTRRGGVMNFLKPGETSITWPVLRARIIKYYEAVRPKR